MNIEEARDFALSLPFATEDEFAEGWISYRVDGKWFMLIELAAPEPRLTLKFSPAEGEMLRGLYPEILPGFHMNHRHWSNIYLQGTLRDDFIESLIRRSYALVASALKKSSPVYSAVREMAESCLAAPI